MPIICNACNRTNAVIKRPKNGKAVCKLCFFELFENEIHETIVKAKLFERGEKVAIAASGGKDSTVLAYVVNLLNQKYDYGLDLCLLSIDEGIPGYRDDSLKTVEQNSIEYNLPLKVLAYKDLYGWAMNEVVKEIGLKNNCTFCGVFRRQALDRGAERLGVHCLAIGHNADDLAETILMNVLRGDSARLHRCTNIVTSGDNMIRKVKPLKYAYEKEIVMYAYHKNLTYFSTECVYAPNAYRGHVRGLIKDLERINPMYILNVIHSGEHLNLEPHFLKPVQQNCKKCNYISSQPLCKACVLLEGLNRGVPKLGISKTSKVNRYLKCSVVCKCGNDQGCQN